MSNKNKSKVIRCEDYRWKSVESKKYKDTPGSYEGVSRYSLLGEGNDEQQLNFQTRFFKWPREDTLHLRCTGTPIRWLLFGDPVRSFWVMKYMGWDCMM